MGTQAFGIYFSWRSSMKMKFSGTVARDIPAASQDISDFLFHLSYPDLIL